MFSGIVEEVGCVIAINNLQEGVWQLQIQAQKSLEGLAIGDSIAVNGVCLTATTFDENSFTVEVVPETQRCTNLHCLKTNSAVNLERSITANQRIGGHFVQGHVDGVGKVLEVVDEAEAKLLTISLPKNLCSFVIDKGFVGIDGMSLTVIKAAKESFTLTLIPHTQAVTVAKHYQVGTLVNLEADMLGKYVAKILETNG
jgi:riboflavin synthase